MQIFKGLVLQGIFYFYKGSNSYGITGTRRSTPCGAFFCPLATFCFGVVECKVLITRELDGKRPIENAGGDI